VSLPTNDKKFNAGNGLAVGASGFPVIDTEGNWVGASGEGQSPYGATGVRGNTGATGAQGDSGASGATGVYGEQGATGSIGTDGASGPTGEIGYDGATGATGADGYTGSTGVIGITGDQGEQGEQGPDGVQGPTGETGATGGFGGYRAGTWAFDPAYTSNIVDLSNGNNTAVDNDAGFANALGTIRLDNTSGNYYYMFSILVDYASNNGSFIGIANRSADVGNSNYFLGSDTNSAGFAFNGEYWYEGGVQSGSLPTWGTGDVVDIAVDQDDSFIWIRVNGGDWNNDPTANPGNYTGGLSTYALSGPWYPAVSIYGVEGPTQLTIREYAQYTVPTGSANYTFLPASVQAIQGYTGASGVTGETGATGPNGARYHTTSTTTLSLTTGATGVTVVDDYLNYSTGQTILLHDGYGKHIHATVTSYDAGTKILAFTPIDHTGTGTASSWEINLDGAEGAAGATGVTGDQGPQGPDGEQGLQGSSFGTEGATGAIGATGTVGLDGATGYAGATGSTGIQGASGSTGLTGQDGADGYQGSTGADGVQGDIGDQGTQGASGATGYTGATGAQGTNGSEQGITFDTSYGHSGPNQTISNGDYGPNTVIQGSVTAAIESALTSITQAEISPGNTGNVVFAIQVDSVAEPDNALIGLGDAGMNENSFLGDDTQSWGVTASGKIYYDNNIVGTGLPTFGAGDIVEFAIDPTNFYFWMRVNNGLWNNDPTADPATGSGSIGWSLAQTYGVPAVSTYQNDSFEIITTAPYELPAGFSFLGDTAPTNTGYTGSTGATGVQGPVGNQGFDGATGATGYKGSTGASGVDGTVGASGATGLQGATGAAGASGINGSTGATGATGVIGITGDDGVQGASGATGLQGATGPDGEIGIDGATGSYGMLLKATASGYYSVLSVGDSSYVTLQPHPQTGDYSYAYSAGLKLIISKDVDNYMEVTVDAYDSEIGKLDFTVRKSVGSASGVDNWTVNLDGAVGAQGATGVTGDQGPQGPDGEIGTTGDIGDQGYQGASGATGPDGDQGYQGATGPDGEIGTTGDIGDQGYQGATGPDGEIGTTGDDGSIGYDGATGFSLASGSTGISGTSQTVVDIFAANEIGTAKYLVQGVDGSTNVQATEVILTQNATGVYITEYATLRTGSKVMDVTATTNGSVISLKVTPQTSGTNVSWVRESVQGRIGGTTIDDPSGLNVFSSFSHDDIGSIPAGKAYVYPGSYWYNSIDFNSLIGTSVTFDAAGVGPQNPAIGTIFSWDGTTLVVVITSGNFTSRADFDKITYGY
jgi:collagen type VII alpha